MEQLSSCERSSRKWPLLIILPTILIGGCKKETAEPDPVPQPPVASVTHRLKFQHHVDQATVTFDSIAYSNEHGHAYDVDRLEYYISNITMHGSSGTADHFIVGPFLVNARTATDFALDKIPNGNYDGASFLLGLPPELNTTNALPNTIENVEMAWPEPMGGGYHFLKFEGHFMHDGNSTGFAIHLGRNENLVQCETTEAFTITEGDNDLVLDLNLNEIFRGPHTYDLETGSYSMGSSTLMAILHENCADAFHIHLEH